MSKIGDKHKIFTPPNDAKNNDTFDTRGRLLRGNVR